MEYAKELDNPAGRLSQLLRSFVRHADKDQTIVSTWSKVLDCSRESALLHLADVAALIPRIRDEVQDSGDEQQVELFDHFWRQWMAPVYFPGVDATSTPSPGATIVAPGSIEALGSLSAFLSATRSEGVVPEADTLAEVRERVSALIAELSVHPDLPEDLRSALTDHLSALLRAIDHFRIGGPDAIRASLDRLLIDLLKTPENSRKAGIFSEMASFVGGLYRLFKLGPEVNRSLEGWIEVLGELPPG